MTVGWPRVAALLHKEWLELRTTLAPWLPALLILPALCFPFVFTIVVPALTNEPLEQSGLGESTDAIGRAWPALLALPPAAAVQALFFQQFLVVTILVPVSGAMSIAAHSIIGEKQGRSLEPLLATPLTPLELLLAKVLASFAPALVLEVVAVALYFGAIAALAEPGVFAAVLSARTLVLVILVGPLASLVALQLVVLASTRAKDSRSAQQVGVLVVLPLVGLMVGQGLGAAWMTLPVLAGSAVGLACAWLALLGLSAALFSQEHVLTRWR